jgi:hypothetical protein
MHAAELGSLGSTNFDAFLFRIKINTVYMVGFGVGDEAFGMKIEILSPLASIECCIKQLIMITGPRTQPEAGRE